MKLAILNVIVVLFSGAIAYWEGRLTHKQLGKKSIPWWCHGGVWADLLLLTPVIYYLAPLGKEWPIFSILYYGATSIIVTAACHVVYALTQPIPGHVVEPTSSGLGKFPFGGCWHFGYATIILALILLFYLQPSAMDKPALQVSILLTAYTPLAVIQPGWYIHKIVEEKGYLDLQGFLVSALLVGAVWYGYFHIA
ncbi:MAG: hypothetical protein WCW26_02570 [Candidatus Buchananbacteria bacterium]